MTGTNRKPLPSGDVTVHSNGRLTVNAAGGRQYGVRSDGTVASYRDSTKSVSFDKQIHDNPDLTEDDRQKMLNNLSVIVLANNRRVDISLSTTGQQSVHRYPFNAKDALGLISEKGVEKQPRKKKPGKK